MRRLLGMALSLALFVPLAVTPSDSQSPVSGQKYLMGRLMWAENAAISIELNGKTLKLEIGPATELWRHGTELQSTSQLALGEDVRAIYTDVAADGSPKPTLVVESGAHDTVKMAPHHVAEYRFCSGILLQATKDSIALRTGDNKVCVVQVDATTQIWRGQIVRDATMLHIGVEISASSVVHYPQETLVGENIGVGVESATNPAANE
jgi:hypothetical protein